MRILRFRRWAGSSSCLVGWTTAGDGEGLGPAPFWCARRGVVGTERSCKLGTILLTACAQVDAKAQHRPSEAGVVPITTQQGITIWAEVADTLPKRARGLMFRDSLASDRSMLFIFPEPQLWVIWMKNTRIPLDIIWLDRDKRVVHVESNVPICRRTDEGCPQYQPNKKASYVLELNAGRAASFKLEKGARLTFAVEPRRLPPR